MSNKKIGQMVCFNNTAEVRIDKNIYRLGIQGIPGTIFKINDGNDCVLGATGIFDFDFEGLIPIYSIVIPGGNNLSPYNDNCKLIIDYIYED